jgi:hypothetical protein
MNSMTVIVLQVLDMPLMTNHPASREEFRALTSLKSRQNRARSFGRGNKSTVARNHQLLPAKWWLILAQLGVVARPCQCR